MCLYNNVSAVKKFISKHKNHETVTVYKRMITSYRKSYPSYEFIIGGLYSPYQKEIYKPGLNKSSSRRTKPSSRNHEEIGPGFHVYLSKKSANNNCGGAKVIVKFTANVKDLLACNEYGVAVFRTLTLSKHEYNKALKR